MTPESQPKLKTVLITGGTDGLGRGAALYLAARGYRVFAGGRNAERRAALDRLAREKQLPIETMALDVCDDVSARAAVEQISRTAGSVDVLINNAGIAIGAALEEISLADLHKQFETNFFGAMRMAQLVLPEMRRRRLGRIINMSSIAGKIAIPLMGPYAASKHALEAVSDSMRLETYPFGIHVVLIEPGYIHSSMSQNAAELSSAYVNAAGGSAYRKIYEGFQKTWEKTVQASKYQPEDCARVILRAIEDRPPKARYLVTRDAKIAARLRHWLSDRAFDRIMRKRIGIEPLRETPAHDE